MESVYRHSDPVHEPTRIDDWWHSPLLSYQVEDLEASEPSIVILYLGDGESDQSTMKTYFMINLNLMRIHDTLSILRYEGSSVVYSALGKLALPRAFRIPQRSSGLERHADFLPEY